MAKIAHVAYGIINGEVCEVVQPTDSNKLDAGTPFFSFKEDAIAKLGKYSSKKQKAKTNNRDVKEQVNDFKNKLEQITNKALKQE